MGQISLDDKILIETWRKSW